MMLPEPLCAARDWKDFPQPSPTWALAPESDASDAEQQQDGEQLEEEDDWGLGSN